MIKISCVTASIRGKGYMGASIGGSTSSALIQWGQVKGFLLVSHPMDQLFRSVEGRMYD